MSRFHKVPFTMGALALGAIAAAGASPAVALNAPGTPTSSPVSPSRSASWTFSWTAPQPDPGYDIVDYEGGFDGAFASLGLSRQATLTAGEGPHTFQVRAVETSQLGLPPQTGAASALTIRVDTLPPSITASFPPPNGLNGWYRLPFTVSFACRDAAQTPIAVCGPNRSFAAGGSNQGQNFVTGRAVDALGNASAPLRVGPLNVDMLVPSEALLSTPGAGAVTGGEPTFTWARSRNGETSGYEHYDVQLQIGGTWRNIAKVLYPQPPARPPDTFSTTRQPGIWGVPLPERVPLQWRVTTFDNAGNQRSSPARSFTIDSTAPVSPSIDRGPSGPVRETQPTFAWTGTQPAFTWSVTPEGADIPVQSGSGAATTETMQPLPDGPYVFSVSQVSPAGVKGAEATRSFRVNTVAPPPPTITSRPPVPTNVAGPVYSWTGEEGSTFRWQVLTAAGASAQNPVETALTTATVGPFGPGAYFFRVSQVDRAGNASGAAVNALTIAGAAATPRPVVARLPALRSAKLSPKPNTTLMTRRPNFRWQKGPAGTTLYNLQVFRVGKKGASPTKVMKAFSAFPRARHYRPSAGKLRAGYCYVWRVWPYVGTRFTKEPLGVSNFCVGSAKQMKAVARRRDR